MAALRTSCRAPAARQVGRVATGPVQGTTGAAPESDVCGGGRTSRARACGGGGSSVWTRLGRAVCSNPRREAPDLRACMLASTDACNARTPSGASSPVYVGNARAGRAGVVQAGARISRASRHYLYVAYTKDVSVQFLGSFQSSSAVRRTVGRVIGDGRGR